MQLRGAARQREVTEGADVHADVDHHGPCQIPGDAVFVPCDDVRVDHIVVCPGPKRELPLHRRILIDDGIAQRDATHHFAQREGHGPWPVDVGDPDSVRVSRDVLGSRLNIASCCTRSRFET